MKPGTVDTRGIPFGADDPRINVARSLYEQGLTTYAIADIQGVHHSTVIYRLRKAGVEIRDRASNGDLRVARDRLPRFMRLVKESGGCWLWQGHIDRGGYPTAAVDRRTVLAHRWFYERLVGPIPEGLTLDHLCRNRSCVNPAHLDPVSLGENLRRGSRAQATHCKSGHPLYGDNLRMNAGKRVCRTCSRRWARDYEVRKFGSSNRQGVSEPLHERTRLDRIGRAEFDAEMELGLV